MCSLVFRFLPKYTCYFHILSLPCMYFKSGTGISLQLVENEQNYTSKLADYNPSKKHQSLSTGPFILNRSVVDTFQQNLLHSPMPLRKRSALLFPRKNKKQESVSLSEMGSQRPHPDPPQVLNCWNHNHNSLVEDKKVSHN